MSNSYQSLSHSKWDCKYHLVFVPKYRKKAIFGEIRQHLGGIFHELACQKECRIVEGHLMRGYAVSTVGFEEEAICRYIREQEGNDQSGRF